jgi:hypothetical protein
MKWQWDKRCWMAKTKYLSVALSGDDWQKCTRISLSAGDSLEYRDMMCRTGNYWKESKEVQRASFISKLQLLLMRVISNDKKWGSNQSYILRGVIQRALFVSWFSFLNKYLCLPMPQVKSIFIIFLCSLLTLSHLCPQQKYTGVIIYIVCTWGE